MQRRGRTRGTLGARTPGDGLQVRRRLNFKKRYGFLVIVGTLIGVGLLQRELFSLVSRVHDAVVTANVVFLCLEGITIRCDSLVMCGGSVWRGSMTGSFRLFRT